MYHSPEGVKMKAERKRLAEFYQHVQREIKPLKVSNPYTKYFNFTIDSHQSRRDNEKYLSIMDCITLFFQHQRETYVENGEVCVVTHLIDVVITHFIMRRLFNTTLDELPPQTRNFYNQIEKYIIEMALEKHIDVLAYWIYRFTMRKITTLSNSRSAEHAARLLEYEYLVSKRDANGIAYRLRFRPDEFGNTTPGLELVQLAYLKKRASKKQKEEYDAFLPQLIEIFKAFDPDYKDGEY